MHVLVRLVSCYAPAHACQQKPSQQAGIDQHRSQARTCYTRYNEFYRCKELKGEEDDECKFYQRAYRALCPGDWIDAWNEQREEGTWYGRY